MNKYNVVREDGTVVRTGDVITDIYGPWVFVGVGVYSDRLKTRDVDTGKDFNASMDRFPDLTVVPA